jgi:hypothetical protein
MLRAFHLLILLGAMIGLFGLEGAYAAGPRMAPVPVAASGMDADCMAMMEKQQPQPAQAPCKGMTLDCIAAMGCIVPLLAVPQSGAGAAMQQAPALVYWTVTPTLTGNELPPEQHPPTILG